MRDGNGVYSVDQHGESAKTKVEDFLAQCRINGVNEKVWTDLDEQLERIRGSVAIQNDTTVLGLGKSLALGFWSQFVVGPPFSQAPVSTSLFPEAVDHVIISSDKRKLDGVGVEDRSEIWSPDGIAGPECQDCDSK